MRVCAYACAYNSKQDAPILSTIIRVSAQNVSCKLILSYKVNKRELRYCLP